MREAPTMTCPACPSARSTPPSANAHGKGQTFIPPRRPSRPAVLPAVLSSSTPPSLIQVRCRTGARPLRRSPYTRSLPPRRHEIRSPPRRMGVGRSRALRRSSPRTHRRFRATCSTALRRPGPLLARNSTTTIRSHPFVPPLASLLCPWPVACFGRRIRLAPGVEQCGTSRRAL
ncbi:hypothetical protein FIBSPDRAFT_104219 [Athelia psychrophila]|uniref:Uncharacterized protein n=1 Tax=Athelia psychrophila TaxID=1759441 RepID=A0A166DDJ8_9AGAM|nr:hypothetical protein FIBSPDRAFT_104219 [Fibularhizoctonia sp. CBS 109695]